MNHNSLQPTPSWACPYCDAVFVSPSHRLRHLNDEHSETPDTSGAYSAHMELQAVIAATDARYHGLLEKRINRERGVVTNG